MGEIIQWLDRLKNDWETLNMKKNKLKGTTYYCSQELKKSRKKLKERSQELRLMKDKHKELEKQVVQMNDKITLNEDKLNYYKKQEIELSFAKSIKTMNSDELNPRLIQQNQKILERFHREEERSNDLEEENSRLRNQNEKNTKKIFNLKLEINKINQEKESGVAFDIEVNQLKEQLSNKNEEVENLEDEIESLKDKIERVNIVCSTYEGKMNELIDRHNEDIENYETVIESLRKEMQEEKFLREKENSSSQKFVGNNSNDKNLEIRKLKDALIRNKQLETDLLNFKSEQSDLKIDLLNTKQKYMNLMNKYSLLKKKVQKG